MGKKRGRKPMDGVDTHFKVPGELYDYVRHFGQQKLRSDVWSDALRALIEDHKAKNVDMKLTLKSS